MSRGECGENTLKADLEVISMLRCVKCAGLSASGGPARLRRACPPCSQGVRNMFLHEFPRPWLKYLKEQGLMGHPAFSSGDLLGPIVYPDIPDPPLLLDWKRPSSFDFKEITSTPLGWRRD